MLEIDDGVNDASAGGNTAVQQQQLDRQGRGVPTAARQDLSVSYNSDQIRVARVEYRTRSLHQLWHAGRSVAVFGTIADSVKNPSCVERGMP